jgi:hypothetical protein
MIFLLNREQVVWEIVELSRLHMCEVLRVPTAAIEAKVELANEKLSPEFLVDADQCKGVTKEQIREVMGDIYAECKAELDVRLYGLTKTRESVLRELRCESEENAGQA